MQLPFGKKALCGNYYVLKKTRTLTKKEMKKLREGGSAPASVLSQLERGGLPYIEVGTVSGSWRVEFVCEMGMYKALDEIPVAMDQYGVLTYYGEHYQALGNLINGWFAYTSTVGDAEYQSDVLRAMKDYLNRAGETNKAPLKARENERVLADAEADARHGAMLEGMLNDIKKEDGNKE